MPPRVTITGLDGIPEVQPGADLAAIILEGVAASGEVLQDGDLLVVTHKIVSKAEGQLVDLRTIAPSDLARRHAEKWAKDARQIEVVLREAARIVRMERNPNWRGDRPAFDEIQWIKYGSSDAVERALTLGEVDMITEVEPASFDRLNETENIKAVKSPSPSFTELAFNLCPRDICPDAKFNPAVQDRTVRQAIGFSSVCVLAYYAIANASAWTLDASVRARLVPALGIVGCVAVGLALPMASVLAGAAVLAAGVALWLWRFRAASRSRGGMTRPATASTHPGGRRRTSGSSAPTPASARPGNRSRKAMRKRYHQNSSLDRVRP